MTTDPLAEPQRIAFAGDWHQNTDYAERAIAHAQEHGADVVLHLGDFGYNFTRPFLDGVTQALKAAGLSLLFVDGNHECLDAATRAVTRRGFISVDDLRPDDEVLSIDDQGDQLWLPIDQVIRRQHRGQMHRLQSRGVDMVVTPGHRVVGVSKNLFWPQWENFFWPQQLQAKIAPKRRTGRPQVGPNGLTGLRGGAKTTSATGAKTGYWNHVGLSGARNLQKWVEFRGDDLNDKRFRLVVAAGNPAPDRDGISDDMLRLYAWCLTDAHHRRDGGWHFYQRKSAAHRVTNLLDRLGYPYSTSERTRVVKEICGKPVTSNEPEVTVRLGVEIGRALPWNKAQLPAFVWELSKRQVKVFLDELIFCDGSLPTAGTHSSVLYCAPALMRNQLHLLLMTNGHRVSQSEPRPGDHRLNICGRNTLGVITTNATNSTARVSVEEYDGQVWCLAVANGRFFVERKGKTFLTGNCFPKLYRYPVGPDGLRQLTDRVWHLPRGFRWQWAGVRFLALGGAHSVDRPYRQAGLSWWKEEAISRADVTRAAEGGLADVLVSHDCPAGVVIPGIDDRTSPPPFPPLEIMRANEHRQILRSAIDPVRPSTIWHGHYHVNYDATADFGWGPVGVHGLDCDGGPLDENVRVVNVASLAPRGVIA